MADEKKDEGAQGCGGCGCSRSGNPGENASGGDAGSDSPIAWGYSVARSAAAGMDAPKAAGVALSEELQIKEEDVDGFLEACERQGKNPLDVVKYIAENNGIDLSSVPRGDSLKLRLYELLKGVVRKVLIGFVSYCADNYGIGVLQSLISSVGNSNGSGSCGSGSCCDREKSVPRSADKESEVPVRVLPVRLVPVKVGYAFTW